MKSKQKEKRPPLIEGEIQFLNQDSTRRDYLVKSGDEKHSVLYLETRD